MGGQCDLIHFYDRAAFWRPGFCVVWIVALTACDRTVRSQETTKSDCGTNALFILLRLEGHAVTLERLASVMPPQQPGGYSMAELSEAARLFGLRVDGVRFARGDRALKRPAIAFLKYGKDGHFAVLRPVGNTGTMVQVIDPPSVPRILDYDRVFSGKSWTGRVLVARDTWSIISMVPLIATVAGSVLLGILLLRRVWFSRRNGGTWVRRSQRPETVSQPRTAALRTL